MFPWSNSDSIEVNLSNVSYWSSPREYWPYINISCSVVSASSHRCSGRRLLEEEECSAGWWSRWLRVLLLEEVFLRAVKLAPAVWGRWEELSRLIFSVRTKRLLKSFSRCLCINFLFGSVVTMPKCSLNIWYTQIQSRKNLELHRANSVELASCQTEQVEID